MTPEEKVFYQVLGQRIVRLRLAVTTLAALAKALSVSVEELIEDEVATARSKCGRASKLQQQIERISALPRAKQQFVIQMLDTVLQQAS